MANPLDGLYLPASTAYRIKRTRKRTDRRLRPLMDFQALPPAGWCSRCKAEVYRLGEEYCSRCRRDA